MMTQAQYSAALASLDGGLEPEMRAAMEANRATLLGSLGAVARLFAGPVWGAVLALAPILAKLAVRFLLWRLSSMTIGEVADLLSAHRARGQAPRG